MAKTLRYTGEFLTRGSHVCRCEIWREGDYSGEVGELVFPADEPLTIEWSDGDLWEPLVGSTAVLQVESPGDRTYIDLYTVKSCDIRLDVYIDGKIFWSGTLDPEFYEEPYSRPSRYDVSLTFTDFGSLSRLPWRRVSTDRASYESIIAECLRRADINYASIDTRYVSTLYKGESLGERNQDTHGGHAEGALTALQRIGVSCANFFDEDGEASTLEEVLEGILQPLGLRMVQRGGTLWIYDLNGLALAKETRQIVWDGTDQVLGVGEVYNNIKITFSPYADATLLPGDDGDIPEGSEQWSQLLYCDADDAKKALWDEDADSRLRYSNTCLGTSIVCPGGFLERKALMGGGDDTWLVGYLITFEWPVGGTEWRVAHFAGNEPHQPVGREPIVTLPPFSVNLKGRQDYYLHLKVGMLVSALYNPFSGVTDNNWKPDQDRLDNLHWCFMPISVRLDGEDGSTWHWYNADVAKDEYNWHHDIISTRGMWVEGAPSYGDAYLEWYDPDDVGGGKAMNGTGAKTNRQCVGTTALTPRPSIRKREGQYIAPLPVAGSLTVSFYPGLYMMYLRDSSSWLFYAYGNSSPRWQLMKNIELSVVKNTLSEEENEDMEHTGVANADAREDCEIDTIVGVTDKLGARGTILDMDSGTPAGKGDFSRAGRVECPEQLLIGTLFSQYGERRSTLTGDVHADFLGLAPYTDAAQDDSVRFLIRGESLRVREESSDATFEQIRQDNWIGTDEQ